MFGIFSFIFPKLYFGEIGESFLMKDELLTIRELADYLKLTEKTAYKLVAEGKIPGFKVGGSWRFKQSVIEAWILKQSTPLVEEDDDSKKKIKPKL